jgi:LuxR family maltose regulon positive regulatory protein
MTWATGTGTSLLPHTEVKSAKGETSQGWTMAGIESAVEAARRYIIKRPRLTRLLDNANARALMLIAPAGFGKTTLAREWVTDRPHVWYRGTPAAADVAALAAGFAETISEVIPNAGTRAVSRMRATGTPEDDVEIIAELFAEDLAEWPSDLWLVFDDYQFAMEAEAPEHFVDLLLRTSPLRLLLASRKRPTWASARRLLYGEIYELGRNELAMDHDEATAVLAHRIDAPADGLVALAEGWPAVIGLAALTEELELPEGGLPDALYDYFAEELFQAASPGVQRGLCKLALAPSLGDGVAEFLLAEAAAEVISEGMNLGFLASRTANLELHPLLRTFLDSKMRTRATENGDDVERLAKHLAESGAWDDAFTLVSSSFTEALFVTLFESAVRTMVAEARLPTVTRWMELARAKRIDAPVVDLAEAEIAFHQADRGRAEFLALRASQRLGDSHPLCSRALYIAGLSAHLDHETERAREHADEALRTASSVIDKRAATWVMLITSIDFERTDVDDVLGDLAQLHDGSAQSEVQLAIARIQVALRLGTLHECWNSAVAASHVVDRVTDPLVVSSFNAYRALIPALRGCYAESLVEAERAERYVRHVRLPFALPYTRRIRALAELGLRHFSRCKAITEWLAQEAARTSDLYLDIEARLIRARLLLAQGLGDQAVLALRDIPPKFPWEGERREYMATLALGIACSDDCNLEVSGSHEPSKLPDTVETRTLNACTDAILALRKNAADARTRALSALDVVMRIGCLDSFVVAYRAYPALLRQLSNTAEPGLAEALIGIINRARDWDIASDQGLAIPPRQRRTRSSLSRREEEVLGLLSHGLTNKEIAKALYISESTAKVHVQHILEKLGVHTRTEAALRASADGF